MGSCVGSIICSIALVQVPFFFFNMTFKLCEAGAEWLLYGLINQHLTSGNPQWLETNIKLSSPFG